MAKTKLFLILILLSSFFWRFYRYPSRWVLNQDQARDALIANYALDHRLLPLIGSPSSAGPFNFGPIYDWLIMLFVKIFPFDAGPWIGFTLLSSLSPLLFYLIGRKIANPIFGLFLAAISAFSSAEILNAPDMLNTVITSFFVTLTFLALAYQKYFLLGLFAAATMHCHFQSLGLFALLLSTLLVNRHPIAARLTIGFKIATGFLLTFIPLLLFDLKNNFVWIKSVVAYYTGGVNKFYVPIRWLTDIRDFWPHLWGNIITNLPASGYFFIAFFLLALYLAFKKHLFNRYFLTILVAFIIQVLLVRYYRGVRSREYLIAFHPYFIFFTAWSFYIFSTKFRFPFLLLPLLLSTVSNITILSQNSQAPKIYSLLTTLPSGQLAIYSRPQYDQSALPIFYLLYRRHRLDPTAAPIQITINPSNTYLVAPLQTPTSLIPYTPQSIYHRLYLNYPVP